MDGWEEDGWRKERMVEWMEGRRMDGRKMMAGWREDRRREGRMDEWMDGWMDRRWEDGWTEER